MANNATSTANQSIEIRDTLAGIEPDEWNALCNDGNPFLTHQFLNTLEKTGCLGQHNGWYPRYFFLWSENSNDKKLVGAMPAYLKTNSYGEFVFDWAWAEAYERNNMPYYPKLVCSIPFTPATGQRILVHHDLDYAETLTLFANAAKQFCHSEKYSSVHWLFITQAESQVLHIAKPASSTAKQSAKDPSDAEHETKDNPADNREDGAPKPDLLKRIDCQYHWHNRDYESFEDFLSHCTAKRRKTIRRERRYVTDAKLKVDRRMGSTLSEQEWSWVHELYQSTFDRKWGNPSLTLEFFNRIGAVFGDNVLIVLVYDETVVKPEKPIACSVMFVGKTVLYGRYWGCREERNSLHFEACYYQGIEYCIENKIKIFEPGAQGEHKITRGFLPTLTRSAHYIAHSGFREAIAEFLNEETQHVEHRCAELANLLPFKNDALHTERIIEPVKE